MSNQAVFENTEGRFKVLNTCISCAACWKLAPSLLKSHSVEAYAFFYKQPEDATELSLARQAIKICPVCAIIDSINAPIANTTFTNE